jgi:uncharacterized protein (TIGR03083 family)
MNPPSPILLQDCFAPLLDALLSLLAQLSPADWRQPTACAGWTVHDVALHLLGGDLGLLSRQRDGYRPGEAPIDSYDELVALIDRLNAAWLDGARRLSPAVLTGLLAWSGPQVTDYLAGRDPYATGGAVNWAGPDPAPVWLDVAREYTERWHHQQHIRDAVNRPGLTEPAIVRPVLATFAHALPETFRPVPTNRGSAVTLHVPDHGTWTVGNDGERWQLYDGAPSHGDATVTIAAADAWRLFTRGLTWHEALAAATWHGDEELALHLLSATAILA